jgi:hypothetical protein
MAKSKIRKEKTKARAAAGTTTESRSAFAAKTCEPIVIANASEFVICDCTRCKALPTKLNSTSYLIENEEQ